MGDPIGRDRLGVDVLGPVRIRVDGAPLLVRGTKPLAILADLALAAGSTISIQRLVDDLWGEDAPPSASHAVEEYVSRLRGALRPHGLAERILTRAPGYALEIDRADVDALAFEDLARDGLTELQRGDPERASIRLTEALGRWSGAALEELHDVPFAAIAGHRLDTLRLDVLGQRMEADLALGRHREILDEVRALAASHPLDEGLARQLMLALYRCGRQADALAVFRSTRARLVEELGVEPGPELQAMHERVLRQADDLSLPSRPPIGRGPAPAAPRGSAPGRRRVAASLAIAAAAVALGVVAASLSLLSDEPSGAVAVPPNGVAALEPDGDRLTVSASLALRGAPGGLASGDGSVWVSSPEEHEVYRIDPRRSAVVQTIAVGDGSDALVVGGGSAWVANSVGGTVSRIDATTNAVVQSISVGSQPAGIAFGAGAVWVADPTAATLTRIDPTGEDAGVVSDLEVPPFGVAVASDALWVSSASANRVAQIDPATSRVVRTVPVGGGPTAIAIGYGAVWVTNGLDSTVSVLDPERGSVLATIPVGRGPGALAVGAGGVWVANAIDGTLSRIDPSSREVTATLRLGARPVAIAIVNGRLWVASRPLPVARHLGGSLRVDMPGEIASMDPALVYPESWFQVWNQTYDTLVTYERDSGSTGTQLVPDLAIAIPTPSSRGRSYTFVVRPGARYSDGSPVQMADFRLALERTLELNDHGAARFLQNIVDAARCRFARPCDLSGGVVTDERTRTVTFHLTRPDPTFLHILTLPFTAPVPATTPAHATAVRPVPSTGPYRVESFRSGEGMVLARNPFFQTWSEAAQPDGYPDRIEWSFGVTPAMSIERIRAGVTDWAGGLTAAELAALIPADPSHVHVDASLTTVWLTLNADVAPFDDVRVRRAVNLAVDREAIVDIFGGAAVALPACELLPPGMPGHASYCPYTVAPDPAGTWRAPDVGRARELVRRSGTVGMRITVWMSDIEPTYAAIGRNIVSVLRRLGYRADLRRLPHERWIEVVSGPGSRAQVFAVSWTADFASPNNFYDFFLACSSGATRCRPGLDALAARATRLEATDPTASNAAWEHVERLIIDSASIVPLVHPRNVTYVSDRVGNYRYHPVWGLLLDQLWLDERP